MIPFDYFLAKLLTYTTTMKLLRGFRSRKNEGVRNSPRNFDAHLISRFRALEMFSVSLGETIYNAISLEITGEHDQQRYLPDMSKTSRVLIYRTVEDNFEVGMKQWQQSHNQELERAHTEFDT